MSKFLRWFAATRLGQRLIALLFRGMSDA